MGRYVAPEGREERKTERERELIRIFKNFCVIYYIIAFGMHVCSAINSSSRAHFAGLLNFRDWPLIIQESMKINFDITNFTTI